MTDGTTQGPRPIVGYVPGVFDLFHIGHLNILRRSSERCDVLIAGVVTDEACFEIKGRRPIVPFAERLEIVSACRFVHEAVPDTSPDKRVAFEHHPFDVIFKGSDWKGNPKGERLEAQMLEVGAGVEYLPYTPQTSSSLLRETLERLASAL